jgi:hypothetical protein
MNQEPAKATEPVEPSGRERRKAGRPRKAQTAVISVRIADHVYDAYCKTSLRTDIDVRTIMRQVLTFYAPKG